MGEGSSLAFTPRASDVIPCNPLKMSPHWKEEGTAPLPAKSMEHPVLLRTLAPSGLNMCACVCVCICVCFNDSRSHGHDVVSLGAFDLQFPNDYQCWTSFQMFIGHLHIFEEIGVPILGPPPFLITLKLNFYSLKLYFFYSLFIYYLRERESERVCMQVRASTSWGGAERGRQSSVEPDVGLDLTNYVRS